MNESPILQLENLKKYFKVKVGFITGKKGTLKAVDGVSLVVIRGETFGVVGESGCGKSTLARMALGLNKPDSGKVFVDGEAIEGIKGQKKKALRRKMQVVFQNPYSSLNPRLTVGSIVEEPLVVHDVGNRFERREKVRELFEKVGLRAADTSRYPHQFSGGQRQRICIARALALNPELIVCDEPVSALDVSIQAQILALLVGLQEELNVSYLFISHDLSVVRMISDHVAVMYLGKVVESARAIQLFSSALHPYTKALIDSVPIPEPAARRARESAPLQGDLPSPIDPPPGCRFQTRCPGVQDICREEEPQLEEQQPDHFCACHFPES